jgi:N4-gp56 family major capsid protein
MSYVGGINKHVIPPYFSDFLRDNLYPNLYFRQLGTKVTIPRGYGDKIKIPRWDTPIVTSQGIAGVTGNVSAIAQEVTEGAIIDIFGLSAENITGSVKQFAGGRGYTDKLIIVTKANYLEGALESLSRELAFKYDRWTRRNISANAFLYGPVISGDSTYSTSPKANTMAANRLHGKNMAKIRPILDSYNVPPWDDEHFVGLGHPVIQHDVYRDISATGFVPINRYNDPSKILRGEIGSMYGLRLLLSNAVPLYGTTSTFTGTAASANNGLSAGATGGNLWVFGPDAFYSLELEDGGVEVIHHPPGSGGSVGDPANQRGSISVKGFYGVAPAPSKDKRLMRFVHTCGLTP